MARYRNMCTYLWRTVSLRRVLISSALTLSSCAIVLFWTQSYRGFSLWSDTRHQEQTTADNFPAIELLDQQEQTTADCFTAVELLDQQEHQLSSEDKLIHAVDKLPFKTMTPSSLLLEDLYFDPSIQPLVDYNNPVLHQPQINCSESTLLLILIPSHPRSVAERRAIRETWGSVARGRDWPGKGDNFAVKLVFVLGVAEAKDFQPGNIQRAESAPRQDVDAIMPSTDSYFTESKDRTFSDRKSNTSSILLTKSSIINLVYEKAAIANKETLDNMANVLGMKKVHSNRLRHSLQMWRNSSVTGLSNQLKRHTMEGNSLLLIKSDKSKQTASTTAHTPTTPHSHDDANLLEEISFGDILQFDMIDTYANLTRKIIISLQLLLKTCSGVKFILKVDPDIFVNVPLLATFLGRHGDQNSIYGRIYPNSAVERTGKWAVAKSALPISRYPLYAAGNAYVMSADAVQKIVGLASRFPYVLVEDAFITGILASVAQVNRVNVAGFTKWTEPKPDACDFVTDKIYVGNNFTEYDHRLYWREIIDRGGYRCDV